MKSYEDELWELSPFDSHEKELYEVSFPVDSNEITFKSNDNVPVSYNRSKKWGSIQKNRIELDGNSCRACGSSRRLSAHHILPVLLSPELELDIDNLITLCRQCHLFVGHLGQWVLYNPFVVEDSAFWLSRISTCKGGLIDGRC